MSLLDRLRGWATGPAAPEDRATHATWFVIAMVFVTAPFVLRPGNTPNDAVRLGSLQLPSMCVSKRVFDVNCPGCGLTRAFVLIAHGRPRESFGVHRAAIPVYAFMVWQVVLHSIGLWRPRRPVVGVEAALQRIIPGLVILLLVGTWMLAVLGV